MLPLPCVSMATLAAAGARQLSRRLCTWWPSTSRNLPRYDRRSVDDLTDDYDHEMYGRVKGDTPTGRLKVRLALGELRHHARTSRTRKKSAPSTGDYESFYHQRLPRVAEYELPKEAGSDFLKENTVVYPPLEAGDARRPAETCVEVGNVSVDPKALLLFGIGVSGLSVESALAKLSVLSQRGDLRQQFRKLGHLAPLAIRQAIEAGVKQMMLEESVEFQSNMWVESVQVKRQGSYVVLGKNARWTLLAHRRPYSLLRVRLREGQPPQYYHPAQLPAHQSGWLPNRELLLREKERLRAQRIYRQL